MRITESQRKALCNLLHYAFLEIRMLGASGKGEQAGELADAFHNLPKDIWKDDFSLEQFRDDFLKPYQEKYPEHRTRDYVKTVTKIIASEEDCSTN